MNRQEESSQAQRPKVQRHGPVMGVPMEKAKDFKGTLKRLLSYLKPYRFALLLVIFAAILSTIFSIVSPKIIGLATTQLFDSMMDKLQGVPDAAVDFHALKQILIILAILYTVSALFSYLQQYIMSGVAQKTVYELRKEVQAKISRLPIRFFDSHANGEILSRAINDVDTISSTLQQSLTQLITSAITLVGIIVMMLTISPLMTLIIFLTIPLSLIVTKAIASRSQAFFKGQQKALGALNAHVEEMYTGHMIVKAFRREQKAIKTFNTLNDQLYQSGWRALFISGIIMPLMSFISNLGYVLVSIVGGILVAQRAIAIGDVQAFIIYMRQFTHPITQLANIANIIQATIASAERVFELLDEEEDALVAGKEVKRLVAPQGNVRFQNVSFRYHAAEPLLEDLTLDVRTGETVAIVGPTGAGKTTLINLLMRFYELDGGMITIDGVDIRQLQREELHQLFGIVLQDTWLFHGSIYDNIAYGRKDASAEEVMAAARAAQADHFIRTLPDGYHTILNEDASNLSQGQKQLLTIARAILADPTILILDEATSNVDTRTELHIQAAMERLMEGRTSFVIAHRLSTIRNADLILVMDQGRIIEQGDHQRLLAQGGFYADLYQSQFTGRKTARPAQHGF